MTEWYSGLEVHQHSNHHAAQHESIPEAISRQPLHSDVEKEWRASPKPGPKPQPKRICGLTKRVFWWLVAVVVLIIAAAAIGGAVGGTLVQKSKNENKDESAPKTSSGQQPTGSTSTPTPTSSTSITITTSTEISPTQTLIHDCPSANNSIYSALGLPQYRFRKACGRAFNGKGFDAGVNFPTRSLNDCIDACADFNRKNASEIATGDSKPCTHVCWRNKLDGRQEFKGHCFGGYQVLIVGASSYSSHEEDICDSAAWENLIEKPQ